MCWRSVGLRTRREDTKTFLPSPVPESPFLAALVLNSLCVWICNRAPALKPFPPLHTQIAHACFCLSLLPPPPPLSLSPPSMAQTYLPCSVGCYPSLAQPVNANTRLSSVSSHDSGFISQDAMFSKPPSPMPSDLTSQVSVQGGGRRMTEREADPPFPVSPCLKIISPTMH